MTYTGFKTFDVVDQLIDDLHTDGKIQIWDKRYTLYPNMYLELRSTTNEKHTALGRVDSTCNKIIKVSKKTISGVTPRNREQIFALDALTDDNIPVVVLTGKAGSGKTLLAVAAGLHKILDKQVYKRLIITRPMSEVGKYKLGALPGGVMEKFEPYLLNFTSNMEQLIGKKGIVDLIERELIEVIPIQLFRGASFTKSMMICDELQVLDNSGILTIGTRIGENSKIVIMGDLGQRDEPISKEKTGIYKLVNDKRIKESPLVAVVELQKCERSPVAALFADVFEESSIQE